MKHSTPKPFNTLYWIGSSFLWAFIIITLAVSYYVGKNYIIPARLVAENKPTSVQTVYDTVKIEVVKEVQVSPKPVKPKPVETKAVEAEVRVETDTTLN